MHPNPAFRNGDRALHEALIDQIGFGMVFANTPNGPRVAHTALLSTGDGVVQFHLARGNALASHLEGMTALAVVNGPDGYVSPRWYTDPAQVPTWNYVALELEGRVRRMDRDGLTGLLTALSARNEGRLEGAAWTLDKMPPALASKMIDSIVGFELEVLAWRPTFKLSQNKSPEERARVADGLAASGGSAISELMRRLVP